MSKKHEISHNTCIPLSTSLNSLQRRKIYHNTHWGGLRSGLRCGLLSRKNVRVSLRLEVYIWTVSERCVAVRFLHNAKCIRFELSIPIQNDIQTHWSGLRSGLGSGLLSGKNVRVLRFLQVHWIWANHLAILPIQNWHWLWQKNWYTTHWSGLRRGLRRGLLSVKICQNFAAPKVPSTATIKAHFVF